MDDVLDALIAALRIAKNHPELLHHASRDDRSVA